MDGNASSPEDIASAQPVKRRKTDIWHHVDALSESNVSVVVPASDILAATHDSLRTLSEPVKSPLSPWTASSESTAERDSEKPRSPLEQVVARKRSKSVGAAPFVPDSDLEEIDDATFRVSQNEKSTVTFDFSAEKARRWADAVNVPGGFYTEEEKDLFYRLAMRGFEPLIPKEWQSDFPTLPNTLFSDLESDSEPLIQALKSSKTYGADPPSTSDDADSKFISQFDLEEMGHDVWNSLAVAITVMKIRRTATQLADKGLGGYFRLAPDARSATDVDI
ncbi:hypothetical protein BBP40_006001 [Aspergillus hancockii]|nr:hypothetical protein BBP40_006001 [Aspergillus hancockii]